MSVPRTSLVALIAGTALATGAGSALATVATAPSGPVTSPDGQVSGAAITRTATVRLGPYTLPASTSEEDEHNPTTKFELSIPKPCSTCFITGYKPNMVYSDGSNANVNTGPMLHHVVIFNSGARDVVCGGPERSFASGNERVASALPAGYGIKVNTLDRWSAIVEMMNSAQEAKQVYVTFTFTYEAALGSSLKAVTPLWLDAGSCLNSEFAIPEGVSETSNTWRSTVSGNLVHMRGHVHHGGKWIKTENTTNGSLVCDVVTEQGGDPEFIDHHGRGEISAAPPCTGTPLARIEAGDTLKVTAHYEIHGHTHDDAMGIMHGWVDLD